MALIECPDCGTQVSDRAAACIKCGAPITLQPTSFAQQLAPPKIQVIEQTGKGYKATQAIGVVAIMVGVVIMIAYDAGTVGYTGGATIALIGLLMYLFARIGAWWDHQ